MQYIKQFPASGTPEICQITLLYKLVVIDWAFQLVVDVCGCPFCEPRVFEIAHIELITLYQYKTV